MSPEIREKKKKKKKNFENLNVEVNNARKVSVLKKKKKKILVLINFAPQAVSSMENYVLRLDREASRFVTSQHISRSRQRYLQIL
jgi:hypothetical protein